MKTKTIVHKSAAPIYAAAVTWVLYALLFPLYQVGHFLLAAASYYLPTTLKLLRSYDELSRQGVSGQNITGTMEKVEGMMAAIVLAFEKQLDSLFGDQAMDISTDITVLDNMMAREGLTGGDAVHQAAQENPVADPQPELDIRNAGDAQTQPPQAEDSVDAGNGITLEL